jgi:hypothetical protein
MGLTLISASMRSQWIYKATGVRPSRRLGRALQHAFRTLSGRFAAVGRSALFRVLRGPRSLQRTWWREGVRYRELRERNSVLYRKDLDVHVNICWV